MNNNKQKIIEGIWFFVIVVFFTLSIFFVKNGVLQERLASFGVFAPLVLIVLKISTLVVAPLGGVPLYILSGALFGTWKGFLFCFIGDTLGSAICFMIGRHYGERVVKFFVGEMFFIKIIKFTSLLNGASSYIKARFAAMNMPEILAYAAGMSQINFWKFMLLHMPLYIVIDLVYVVLGSQIVDFTTKFSFLALGVVIMISCVGIFLFYRDYQKVEGM